MFFSSHFFSLPPPMHILVLPLQFWLPFHMSIWLFLCEPMPPLFITYSVLSLALSAPGIFLKTFWRKLQNFFLVDTVNPFHICLFFETLKCWSLFYSFHYSKFFSFQDVSLHDKKKLSICKHIMCHTFHMCLFLGFIADSWWLIESFTDLPLEVWSLWIIPSKSIRF